MTSLCYALLQWGNRHKLRCLWRTVAFFSQAAGQTFPPLTLVTHALPLTEFLSIHHSESTTRVEAKGQQSRGRTNINYFSGMICGNLQACWILAFLPSKFAVSGAWKSTGTFRKSAFHCMMKKYYSLKQNNYQLCLFWARCTAQVFGLCVRFCRNLQ